MDFNVIEKEGFTVFGPATDFNPKEDNGELRNLWSNCFSDGTSDLMTEVGGLEPGKGEFGSVCYNFNSDNGNFRYMITTKKGIKTVPEHLEVFQVPKCTWGVFSEIYEDHEDIHLIWDRLFDYLESTEYHLDSGPQLEQYYSHPKGTLCEVWVPLVKK